MAIPRPDLVPETAAAGRDALAVLQRLCANEVDVSVDRMVYTAMLNLRGVLRATVTVVRLRQSAS